MLEIKVPETREHSDNVESHTALCVDLGTIDYFVTKSMFLKIEGGLFYGAVALCK